MHMRSTKELYFVSNVWCFSAFLPLWKRKLWQQFLWPIFWEELTIIIYIFVCGLCTVHMVWLLWFSHKGTAEQYHISLSCIQSIFNSFFKVLYVKRYHSLRYALTAQTHSHISSCNVFVDSVEFFFPPLCLQLNASWW